MTFAQTGDGASGARMSEAPSGDPACRVAHAGHGLKTSDTFDSDDARRFTGHTCDRTAVRRAKQRGNE